jgi:CDP-diacylglycerol--glycerol-3-phosphate 3-phosphatidyltransferase
VAALALTTLRVLLAPALLWITRDGTAGAWYVACCIAALLSDIADGVIARRAGVDTAPLRRYDSIADTVFYAAAAWTVWRVHPEVVRRYWPGLGVVVALEVTRYLFDLHKFGREASYHAWSAKLWGLSLATALVALMGFGRAMPWVPLTIVLGVIADVEGLAISIVLPVWRHDVKSLAHALTGKG